MPLLAVCPALLVDCGTLSLNPLFHYPPRLGYWNCSGHDFFGPSVIVGFDAFSLDYGGVVVD